jgi:hypothetical protein
VEWNLCLLMYFMLRIVVILPESCDCSVSALLNGNYFRNEIADGVSSGGNASELNLKCSWFESRPEDRLCRGFSLFCLVPPIACQNNTLRSRHFCSSSRISQNFMEPKVLLPCSQERSSGPYPEPDQSSPYSPILSL